MQKKQTESGCNFNNFGKKCLQILISRGGGANPGGESTYSFAEFPQKLHEIERI